MFYNLFRAIELSGYRDIESSTDQDIEISKPFAMNKTKFVPKGIWQKKADKMAEGQKKSAKLGGLIIRRDRSRSA